MTTTEKKMNETLSTMIKSAVLVGTGLMLYAKISAGTLTYYINPRFVWLPYVALLIVISLALAMVYQLINRPKLALATAHDHTHDHTHDHDHDQPEHSPLCLALQQLDNFAHDCLVFARMMVVGKVLLNFMRSSGPLMMKHAKGGLKARPSHPSLAGRLLIGSLRLFITSRFGIVVSR